MPIRESLKIAISSFDPADLCVWPAKTQDERRFVNIRLKTALMVSLPESGDRTII